MSDLDRPAGKRKRKKAARPDHVHPLLDSKLRPFLDGVFKEPGFGECTQLCDVWRVRQVCGEWLPGAFEYLATCQNPSDSARPFLGDLQTLLLGPLRRYEEQLEDTRSYMRENQEELGMFVHGRMAELEAVQEFCDSVLDVRKRLRWGPWTTADSEACAAVLELAWYKWIASIATAHLTFKVPVGIARARAASARSKGGAPPGRPPGLDQDRMFKRCQEMERLLGRSGAAAVVAREFDCSATYVRVIWRRFEAMQKNETKPAG